MRISDWSSDVCSSDLLRATQAVRRGARAGGTASRDRRSVLPQAAQDDDATGRAPSRIAPPATYESGGRPRGRPFCSRARRSEEHTSELQSLMRISYAVFCLKKKKHNPQYN